MNGREVLTPIVRAMFTLQDGPWVTWRDAGSYDAWPSMTVKGTSSGLNCLALPVMMKPHIDSNDNIFLTGYTDKTWEDPMLGLMMPGWQVRHRWR